jgi:hypothetical protein
MPGSYGGASGADTAGLCGRRVQSGDLLLPVAAARREAAADAAARARRGPAAVWLSAAAHLAPRVGWRINHKKTYRLYRVEQHGVRVRRRHKQASQVRVRPAVPTASMKVVHGLRGGSTG